MTPDPWQPLRVRLPVARRRACLDHDQPLEPGADRFEEGAPNRAGVDPEALVARLRKAGGFASVRGCALRVSPHAWNDAADLDRLLEALPGQVDPATAGTAGQQGAMVTIPSPLAQAPDPHASPPRADTGPGPRHRVPSSS